MFLKIRLGFNEKGRSMFIDVTEEVKVLQKLINEEGYSVYDAVVKASGGDDAKRRTLAEYASKQFYAEWSDG